MTLSLWLFAASIFAVSIESMGAALVLFSAGVWLLLRT